MKTYGRIVTKTWHCTAQRTSKIFVKRIFRGFVGTRLCEICRLF
nr:MAG TPA: hypothetical protein [Caudoviricetes sp.]